MRCCCYALLSRWANMRARKNHARVRVILRIAYRAMKTAAVYGYARRGAQRAPYRYRWEICANQRLYARDIGCAYGDERTLSFSDAADICCLRWCRRHVICARACYEVLALFSRYAAAAICEPELMVIMFVCYERYADIAAAADMRCITYWCCRPERRQRRERRDVEP